MPIIQIVFALFLFFAASRVYLRFRSNQLSPLEFIFWILLFIGALLGIFLAPELSVIARTLGIGRGVDLIIYGSIAVVFYLVFRIYIQLEEIRHEITVLVRRLALEHLYTKKKNKKSL